MNGDEKNFIVIREEKFDVKESERLKKLADFTVMRVIQPNMQPDTIGVMTRGKIF